MIIGVVGTLAAGKTTTIEILHKEGFRTLTLSDFLREKARARRLKTGREALYSLGNELRAKFGPAALMQEALNRMEGHRGDYAIDGLRTPAEIALLRTLPGAIVIGVDAKQELRFSRAKERQERLGREENASTMEEFLAQEERENSADSYRPQLRKVLASADALVRNDGTREQLRVAVLSAVLELRQREKDGTAGERDG